MRDLALTVFVGAASYNLGVVLVEASWNSEGREDDRQPLLLERRDRHVSKWQWWLDLEVQPKNLEDDFARELDPPFLTRLSKPFRPRTDDLIIENYEDYISTVRRAGILDALFDDAEAE